VTALPGLAPPHSLRIHAPAWGVDPSTKRMAFAALIPPGLDIEISHDITDAERAPRLDWSSVSLPNHPNPATKLAGWTGRIGHHVQGLVEEWGEPALVVIEQPFSTGHKTEPSSYYAVAALLAGLGLSVPDGAEILMMPPQSWKLKATGSGYNPGVPKDTLPKIRREAEKDRLLRWAIEAGYTGSSQDEADACGIATAAGVILDGR
jgi:hypothetical protein